MRGERGVIRCGEGGLIECFDSMRYDRVLVACIHRMCEWIAT